MEQSSDLASGGESSSARVSTMSNGGDADHRIGHFLLSPSSALKIRKGDITRWFVDGSSDAIVNPANELMLGGAGADGAIHRAAGPELRAACHNVQVVRPGTRCPTGEARITPGFRLPASHVIHTVGPIYYADPNPEASLRSAYRNSLRVAKENNIQYIAFPAISCGVFGYPFDEAAMIAISTVREFANDFQEYVATLREQLEQLVEERTSDGLPRVSKAQVNDYSEKIEALAAKLAASVSESVLPETLQPISVTSVKESPLKAVGESSIPISPELRRRFVAPSNIEDRPHDSVVTDYSAPVKLDAASRTHIDKHI